MALRVHLLKSYDRSRNIGVTHCGEPFHVHPQLDATTQISIGEFEAQRRIGGLTARGEHEFGLEAMKKSYGQSCARCRRVWVGNTDV